MSKLLAFLIPILVMVLPGVLVVAFARRWLSQWWSQPLVRQLIGLLPASGVICLLAIYGCPIVGKDPVDTPLGLIAVAIFLSQIATLIVLPISALVFNLCTRTEENPVALPHSPRRRFLLQSLAVALPITALGTSMGGVVTASSTARSFTKVFSFPGLPSGLAGLRILHLTDIHLGGFTTLRKLADILATITPMRPQLIVITGDISDDLRLLPEALRMISALQPELGTFATLGNHEYGNGVEEVRTILAASEVQLLCNESVELDFAGQQLCLAGIDDAAGDRRRRQDGVYLAESVKAALEGVSPHQFTILLSHRPDAFDVAAEYGVELTLAGHTHGGQLGLAGRSVLALGEIVKYPWGHYVKRESQLYTSSGTGQWLPFRLGCPAEAPIIELADG